MAPRVVWCLLLGLAVGWFPSARAVTTTSTSDTTSDPSCVTVQVSEGVWNTVLPPAAAMLTCWQRLVQEEAPTPCYLSVTPHRV